MALKLVHSTPEFFAHRGVDAVDRGEGFGCSCAECGLEIAAPWTMRDKLIWCLYCGMEKGHVPMIEIPFGTKYSFGLTLDECRAIAATNDLDQLFETWAEQHGKFVRVF